LHWRLTGIAFGNVRIQVLLSYKPTVNKIYGR
jgi:hypothetical protein